LGPTRQTNPSCLSCGLSADAGSAVQTLYRMAPSRTSSWRSWAAPPPAGTAGSCWVAPTEPAYPFAAKVADFVSARTHS
jgi:hypothetical protein